MITADPAVDDYVDGVDETWHDTILRLRAQCRTRLVGYREHVAYAMPCYSRDDVAEIAFKRQARYLSLYVSKKEVLDGFRDDLGSLSVGKGCVRFARPAQVDFELIGRILDATVTSDATPC